MTRGGRYVATAALIELLDAYPGNEPVYSEGLAPWLVQEAWDVEHFPVAGKVTITLDLDALDQPAQRPDTD
jgi:hypothetical protein